MKAPTKNNINKQGFGIYVTESDKGPHTTSFLLKMQLLSLALAVSKEDVLMLPPSRIVCGDSGVNFIWQSSEGCFDDALIHQAKLYFINRLADFAFSDSDSNKSPCTDYSNFSFEYDVGSIFPSECQFEEDFPENKYTNTDLHNLLIQKANNITSSLQHASSSSIN